MRVAGLRMAALPTFAMRRTTTASSLSSFGGSFPRNAGRSLGATTATAVASSSPLSSTSSSSMFPSAVATATAALRLQGAKRAIPPSGGVLRCTTAPGASSSSIPSFFSTMPTGREMLDAFRIATDQREEEFVGQDVALAMESLVRADCVCFDVDSTVITEEGIDVLAESLGKGAEVAEMTRRAMEGGMRFQDALDARLGVLRPSRGQILRCLRETPLRLTPGVDELIRSMHDGGKDVYLVSGGFRIMIEPVAEILNIPKARIYANHILFDDDGDDGEGGYAGFDANEPTSRDMGKARALERIRSEGGYRCMVMIGDGATDADAKPPAAAFVGFGGVAVREKVRKVADWFVTDFRVVSRLLRQFADAGKP